MSDDGLWRVLSHVDHDDNNLALPVDYLLLRRELLAKELRYIENELIKRGEIKKRLCASARHR